MPYTIAILKNAGREVQGVLMRLSTAIHEARFTAHLEIVQGIKHRGETLAGLHVTMVRLQESKPYCGQHPGECLVGGPRRKSKCLEWDDWVRFHAVVNDVLDHLGIDADAWTCPPELLDKGRKMWVRRGTLRRYRWEWEEDWRHGRTVRIWNHGTADQFEPETR
jgi:hypothetical protein